MRLSGIGLHSGITSTVTISFPAASVPASNGIAFITNGSRMIDAVHVNVDGASLQLSTRMRNDGPRTVEHLMAALWALGETVAEIVVESGRSEQQKGGVEIPIGDGSALPWIGFGSDSSSKRQLQQQQPVLVVRKLVTANNPKTGAFARLTPLVGFEKNPRLELLLDVDFSPRLKFRKEGVFQYEHQWLNSDSKEKWKREIAPARTFCFFDDVKQMRANNLALGGSFENSVVFTGNGSSKPMNPEGLRFEDEWIRHKALDCFGDLSLLLRVQDSNLAPLLHGRYEARFPGHALNYAVVHSLLSDPSNYSIEYC